ncbi:MAG: hypothetical protein IT249_08875 [Chitinophagaceae bacterium]|nr:hypothetical protein [Chitinophagaceae bacterium]
MIIRASKFIHLHKGLWGIIMWVAVCPNYYCKKKNSESANEVRCYSAEKVQSAYTKAKNFLKNNEAAYLNGTLDNSKIGLYIDMMATEVRMEYYINTIALGKGVTVKVPDGTSATIDDELIRNYKEALCNETDDINKKL